jgi:enamine deaminase RidA (YjgF/YER057c/UK114 family)
VQGERIYSGSPFEETVGYARAVVVDGWIFVSGTTGFDPDTRTLPPDVESQCENCFRNIGIALAKAGASLSDLVRLLVIVTSREEFERIIPIVRKHCYDVRPTNTTIIAQLVQPEMRVEIEVTARAPRV